MVDATRAEAIADPLQRCLAYPDPPGSHWTRAATVAYCQYRNQPIITIAQVRDLIEHGKSTELDRLMGEALQAQRTQPQAHGRLDHIFFADFDDGSFDIRPILDAWKRDSPDSAFAYAASGYAYVAMAAAARGGDYLSNTPESNIDAMDRLLLEGRADLQHAMALNPDITPIYVALIRAGAYGFGKDYMLKAARMGLKVAPDNFSIYAQYLWAEEPEWFGSVDALRRIAAESLKYGKQNPLLVLDKAEAPAFLANVRDCCDRPTKPDEFPAVFDDVADHAVLEEAGETAADHGDTGMALVYLSEALRFDPDNYDARLRLSDLLIRFRQPKLLFEHAQRLLAIDPDRMEGYALRGYARAEQGDLAHARSDLVAALAKNPDDQWTLEVLGSIYVHGTRQWDKGWDIANRLIELHPELADGWLLRASIQLHQPRPGLDDTIHYFLAHFGHDPAQRGMVGEMRRILAAEAKGGKDPLAPFRG
jgi:tetratricopeptide (TPR) repeat protein